MVAQGGGSSSAPSTLSAEDKFNLTLHPPSDGSFKPSEATLSLRDEHANSQGVPVNTSLSDYRESEGRLNRLARLKSMFEDLSPSATPSRLTGGTEQEVEARTKRLEARQAYTAELWKRCGGETGSGQRRPEWNQFEEYVNHKEAELWHLFHDIDQNGDGRICLREIRDAVSRAAIEVPEETIESFVHSLARSDGLIAFEEWRNFLVLLPHPADIPEIFRFYNARTPTRIATSQVTQDGDVTMGASGSGWARGKKGLANEMSSMTVVASPADEEVSLRELDQPISEKASGKRKAVEADSGHHDDKENEQSHPFEGAGRFLLAGAIAGAVSRSATAPFDRLKVYLITDSPSAEVRAVPSPAKAFEGVKASEPLAVANASKKAATRGASQLARAVKAIYLEGGLRAFFVGNGLNIVKILPESATKFLTYEFSKRAFAKYVDKVPDQSRISGTSRFISGGVGGVVSQFAIYPVETLKTRLMSSTSSKLKGNALLINTAKEMMKEGAWKSSYRGLVPALVGVFPYSAIDMSTFEALKQAYLKAVGHEPGVLVTLTFGALSGGVGATSVYPLNLVRTRLQAQGSPSHPQRYTGMRDCAVKTFQHEGIHGLYKGLTPSLLKVVPAVSISWATYDWVTKYLDVGHE